MDEQNNRKNRYVEARLKRKLFLHEKGVKRLKTSTDIENIPPQTSDGILEFRCYCQLRALKFLYYLTISFYHRHIINVYQG